MKKNYFIRTFNLCKNLLIISVLLIAISIFLKLLLTIAPNTKYIIAIINIISYISTILLVLGCIMLSLILLIISIEIYKRRKYDTLSNLSKSVNQTFKLRKFIKQHENYEKDSLSTNQTCLKSNPILDNFNKNIKYCVVDINITGVIVILKIPSKQQAQKILIDMEQQIHEEVSHLNPEYYFSNMQRNKRYMYIKGNKR